MQKFTPGPWRACRAGDCSCGQIFGGDGNSVVARAFGRADLDEADVVPDEAAQLANARLISAAPEMYDALAPFAEFARVYLAQGPGGNRPTEGAIYSISFAGGDAEITVEALQRALAALAKATGA